MHFVTTYTFKPHMSKGEVKSLIDMFAAIGEAPGTTAHYVRADGRGGTLVSERETEDIAAVYRNLLNYTDWMEFDMRVVLPVDEAVSQVMDYIG